MATSHSVPGFLSRASLFVAAASAAWRPYWIPPEKDTAVNLARATDCPASLHTSPGLMGIAFHKED